MFPGGQTLYSFLLPAIAGLLLLPSESDRSAQPPLSPEDWRVSLVRDFTRLRTEGRLEEAAGLMSAEPRL